MGLLDRTITFKIEDLVTAIQAALPTPLVQASPWVTIPGEGPTQSHVVRVGQIVKVHGVVEGQYAAGNGKIWKAYVHLIDGTSLNSRATPEEIQKLISAAESS